MNLLKFLVEAIVAAGVDEKTGEFVIPDDIIAGRDKIKVQLEILRQRNSNVEISPKKKILKLNDEEKDDVPNTNKQQELKKETSTSSTSTTTSSSNAFASQSNLQKKLDLKDNIKDFFKERAGAFKIKDPSTMKAESPPPQPKQTTTPTRSNDQALEAAMKKYLPVILLKGKMAEKLKNAAPYNMFLTTVTDSPSTHNDPLSITFQELLDSSLGEIESSVQFNFMVEIGWLLAQYTFAKCRNLPLLILYGSEEAGIADISKKLPNVTTVKVNISTPYGCHHTKMMFFFYKDKSMRIVVSTANLYEDDWHNRVQGMWISDKLPSLPDGMSHVNNGESPTGFREDLMRYLMAYNLPKLQPIIARVRTTDFSKVNVFFVSSVPGTHQESGKGILFGHLKIDKLLSIHSAPMDDTCPIVIQSSSIGNFGPNPSSYLCSEIASSFSKDSAPLGIRRLPQVKIVYPSLNNVLNSHDQILGGGCLPSDAATFERMKWIKDYLYQWKSSSRNRNRAMPHIKTYCRYSDRGLYWFLLTSANMSKSALGSINKSNKLNLAIRINSYEAGVMFFPRIIINKDRFPMNESQQKDGDPIFQLPFDVPLVPYNNADDVPYATDYLKTYLAKRGMQV